LSAHHQDDQAETVLLNLMRGSGPAGLAGIGAIRPFAAGWLARPLLDVPRSALLAYAAAHSLTWIEDPSNQDAQFDRNYLRHEVLPRIEARWPNSAQRIRRSADLAGEAAALLADLADEDAARMGGRNDRLSVAGLRDLAPARQRNLLRHVLLRLGLPMPGAAQLEKIVTDLVHARDDAQPLVAWPGALARRYRDQLYLLSATPDADADVVPQLVDAERIVLRRGLGMLVLQPGASRGLSDAVLKHRLELRYRSGGEEIKPINHMHTKKLKKLLQEEGVVPWMRDQVPLLYANGELVAVADLWIAAGAASEPGTAIAWHNRPAIH
jgi:tRNA(Ile)-lysidine synthase